jgi:hypothetical protein
MSVGLTQGARRVHPHSATGMCSSTPPIGTDAPESNERRVLGFLRQPNLAKEQRLSTGSGEQRLDLSGPGRSIARGLEASQKR